MKKQLFWSLLLLLPLSVLSQEDKPSGFQGYMKLEDGKVVDFSYLDNPADGTNIAYYPKKPGQGQYRRKKGRKLLPFSSVSGIRLLPLAPEEAAELRHLCGDGTLQKATLTLKDPLTRIPELLYLDIKCFDWRSASMPGFHDIYRMEARFLDEIVIQHNP